MGPPPPAPLPDEIVEEILLRLPASDPASLARAAVARKRWCRLVTDPAFRRRFVALHRTPPMLGFLCDPRGGDGFSARFVPTSSFRPRRAVQRSLRPEDARHGRVLLRYSPIMFGVVLNVPGLVVWDPMTEKNLVLPKPPGFCDKWNWKATVLCAAPAGTCNHHDCHRGPFVVVVVANYPNGILSTVYSSQAGAWNKRIFAQNLRGRILRQECRPALVGNALHYTFEREHKILKYDLGTREFSVMEPPLLLSSQNFSPYQRIELTTTEDDQLGLAVVSDSTLHILSRDEEFGWGRSKIIYLKKWGLHVSTSTRPGLVAFAGDIGLAFLRVGNGIFSVNIKSPGVKKVYESSCISCFIPYVNFCTPVMGVTKRNIGPRVDPSSGGRSCVASRLPSQAMGVPSKDDRSSAGASTDRQSCVTSKLLSQAYDTAGGRSRQPVASRRARAAERLQPRRPLFASRPYFRRLGHSPLPQGK